MANAKKAGTSIRFDVQMKKLPDTLAKFLREQGMAMPLNFANFFEHSSGTPELRDEAREVALHTGAGSEVEDWSMLTPSSWTGPTR
jgi:hypothetical protein